MIQPVAKPVVQPVWQPAVSCKQTSNRLSNRLSTGATSCQTGLYNWFDKYGLTTVLNEQLLNEQLFVRLVVKLGCTTGLTTSCIQDTAGCQTGLITGWMFVYMIQPVWHQVVSCKRGLRHICRRTPLKKIYMQVAALWLLPFQRLKSNSNERLKMFYQTQTARRPSKGQKKTSFCPWCPDIWPSNSYSVWIWRKSVQRFRRYFIHKQKKTQTDGAKKQNLLQFTACSKYILLIC